MRLIIKAQNGFDKIRMGKVNDNESKYKNMRGN